MNIKSIITNSNRKLSMETVAQSMKEENNDDFFRISGGNESKFSNKDDSTYVVPALETCYSDNEAVIKPLHLIDYQSESEEEDETFPDTSPSATDRNF